jgi:hypothetical protein
MVGVQIVWRRTGVDGMTAPFFLESLVRTDLSVQRLRRGARWAHLAGFAGGRRFIGYLACVARIPTRVTVDGSSYARSSPVVRGLITQPRRRLGPGPASDLRARREEPARVRVRHAGDAVCDRFLCDRQTIAIDGESPNLLVAQMDNWTPALRRLLIPTLGDRSARVVLPEVGVPPPFLIDRRARLRASRMLTTWTDAIDAGDRRDGGLVDTHVHINAPGRAEWEGFETATCAAAAGGVTTVVDMPLNSIPATTSVDGLRAKRDEAAGRCRVDVAFWGGVVPGSTKSLRSPAPRLRLPCSVPRASTSFDALMKRSRRAAPGSSRGVAAPRPRRAAASHRRGDGPSDPIRGAIAASRRRG